MPPSELPTVLIVSSRAEEIKLITISLRGFFPGCHVEVAYTADEAVYSASTQDCSVILVDDEWIVGTDGSSLITELKRQSPYATVIIESGSADSSAALLSLQSGSDFHFFKNSPAFLTELMFCVREAIDRRDVTLELERKQEDLDRLLELHTDVVYKLDADGRFLSVSSGVTEILGYTAEELIGRPYTTLLPSDQQSLAQHRFNERRSGARAIRRIELALETKPEHKESAVRVLTDVTAKGLYDSRRRFIGTIGLIRDISSLKQHEITAQHLQRQMQLTEELRTLASRITDFSTRLHTPLSAVLQDSQQLLNALHNLHLTERIETLAGHAEVATALGQQLVQAAQDIAASQASTVNDIVDDVLHTIPHADAILRNFSRLLPPMTVNREHIAILFRSLLLYAQAYLATVGRISTLAVTTRTVGTSGVTAESPALFPLSPPTEVEIELHELEPARTAVHFPKPSEPVDLLKVYELARHLNSTIDFTAPVHGPFRVTVRFPISSIPPVSPATATTPSLPDEAARVPAPTVAIAPVRVSAPERRKRHRHVTSIVASVTDGTRTWTGTVANLSSGGASLAMSADMPMFSTQSVEVILRTDVSILELQGSAYVRTMVEISVPVPPVSPRVLVLVFSPPPEPESAVLDSMIEAAAMGSLQFTLEVRLVSGRSLTPLSSSEGMVSPPIITPTENHREAMRIKLETPVGFELTDRAGSRRRLSGFVQNVSRTGACIRLSPNPGPLDGVATLYFAALGRPTPPEPTAPDAVFPAQIIWTMGSGSESSTTSPMKYESALQIGLSFHALTPYAERELNRALHHRLMSEEGSDDLPVSSAMISVSRECRNSRGLSIAIVDDHLRLPVTPNQPIVIIAPGFGQTATDYTALGHYLARHHFRVLRYDHTNHLGQSEGELQQSSLRSMQGDLLKVIEFVHHTWPGVPVGVIASDLAARAALKAAAQSPVLDLLLLINPVTDLQAMLQSVHGHDLVTDYRFGLRRGMTNLLSLNVNHDHFVGEVISGHFTDLASSLQDLRGIRAPLVIVTAPVSPLSALPPTDLPHAFVTALGTRLGVINLPLLPVVPEHRLAPEAVAAFQPILEQVAAALNIQVRPGEFGHEIHRAPVRQHRVELERTRLRHNVSQVTREALWQAYQQQLPQLANLHEHWKFLDDLYRSLTPLDPGTIVMDIGSGHDELARVMMVNQAYRARHRGWVQEAPPEFVALGRSRDSLAETRRTFRTLFQEMESDFGSGLSIHPPVALETIQADWTTALPFGNGALHRIVCNLSLPFVHSPLAVMRELHRVLHPHGRLIVTAFQATTDLSVLYRQHLRRLNQDEFGPEAQVVLHYLGRVREAIRHGLLHTYDRETLSHLFHQVGLTSSQITVGLNGHALLAIVGKREFL